jgi:hypothetical protein
VSKAACDTTLDPCSACIEFIKLKLLTLAVSQNEDRSIQNNKIATMLKFLEGEEVITLLSDLHGVISPIYEVYASKRTSYLDFDSLMRFLTDFSVFPDVVNKSDAFRIFMNLAFPHETLVNAYQGAATSSSDTQSFLGSRINTQQSSKLFTGKRASVTQKATIE